MTWNIAPECISMCFLGIIWVYSRKGRETPSLKNKLFQGCFFVTFFAMGTNILSTMMIQYMTIFPLWLNWIITTIYFILTPLMGMVYCFYSMAIIFDDSKHLRESFLFLSIPAIIYVGLVITNPFTSLIFNVNLIDGYVKGPWIFSTYIVFYAYCLVTLFIAILYRKKLDNQIYRILTAFPIIALLVIIIQMFSPSTLLTGTAATCALLIIYLHIQNKQITMDYVTDLPNRLEFISMIELLLKEKKNGFLLMVVSLRDFKQVNDSFGQQNGDVLLKMVGKYLCQLYGTNNVFRFKGDEFAILISQPDKKEMKTNLDEMKERFKTVWNLKDRECLLSCVAGIVYYPETTDTLENLILAVELAVNKAKKDCHHMYCYFNQEMFANMKRRKLISDILKEKVATEDFDMYYQPIISVETGEFLYAESLVRILDSQVGPIMPSEFIPIAEESGLIIDMTYSILNMVCRFVRRLIDEGIPTNCIHVNFSALQFKQPLLAHKVLDIIEDNHIPCSTIKIEFTESTIAENLENITTFAVEMKNHGILMGLDDFGTGYSNLSSVIKIPFSTIKLDKSLVWAAMQEEKYALTLKNLVKVFKDLDMSIVAEGVETKEQSDFIISSGVDQIQGFYYAKPMPQDDFIQFLKANQKSPL